MTHTPAPLTVAASPNDDLLDIRNSARTLTLENPGTRIVVELAGGVYRLSKPLILDAADSHITWRSKAGERAVISGGLPITGWREGEYLGKAVWIADVPQGSQFTQVWVNGERRSWPKLPSKGFYHFTHLDGQPDSGFTWNRGPIRAGFKAGDIDSSWTNQGEIRITAYQLWFESHLRIDKIDGEAGLVHFKAPSVGSLRDETQSFARYVVENVAEGLCEPGTWYHDRKLSQLIYLPKKDEVFDSVNVVAGHLDALLVLAGTAEAPVVDVRFEHIAFHHAEHHQPTDSAGTVQAAWHVPGAVRLRFAEDCVFYGCEVAHVATYGIQVEAGCVRPVIAACSLFDLGAGGVRLDHESLVTHNPAVGTDLPLVRPEPIAATVIDTTIRDNGHRYPSAVGVFIGNSGHHRILRNHLYDLSYTGISSGWTWGYAPTRTVNIHIEGNHVHHINHRGLLSDNGAIYTLGRHPGGRVVGNFVHDVSCYGYGGWGLYPDEGSSEFTIAGNVVLRTAQAAFCMHFGRACTVTGNLLSAANAHVNLGRQERHRSVTFSANTVVATGGFWAGALTLPASRFLWKDNLLHDPLRPPLTPERLAEMQEAGQHLGTRLADPLLGDLDGLAPVPRADGTGAVLAPAWQGALGAGPRLAGLPASFDEYKQTHLTEKAGEFPVVETLLERTSEPARQPDGTQRVSFRVSWTNVGLVPAQAAAELRVSGAAHIEPALAVDAVLSPGESVCREAAVFVPAGVEQVILETATLAGPAVPHSIEMDLLAQSQTGTLNRLPSDTTLAGLADALINEPLQTIRYGRRGAAFAKVWLAIVGDALALHTEVTDARPHHDLHQPWVGSCLEVFGAPANKPKTTGQVFFQPALKGTEPRVSVRGLLVEETTIGLTSTPTDYGYTLTTLLPLAGLGIAPNATEFQLEIAITAARAQGTRPERGAWVHAFTPHMESDGMSQVKVAG
jgi:hypothetical protein